MLAPCDLTARIPQPPPSYIFLSKRNCEQFEHKQKGDLVQGNKQSARCESWLSREAITVNLCGHQSLRGCPGVLLLSESAGSQLEIHGYWIIKRLTEVRRHPPTFRITWDILLCCVDDARNTSHDFPIVKGYIDYGHRWFATSFGCNKIHNKMEN